MAAEEYEVRLFETPSEHIVYFTVHPPLSHEDVSDIDNAQTVRSAANVRPVNSTELQRNTFSRSPFGVNNFHQAVVTHSVEGFTVLGFDQSDLLDSPQVVCSYIAAAIREGMKSEAVVA